MELSLAAALAAGFAIPQPGGARLAVARGERSAAYYEQVWKWGRVYAARTFVERSAPQCGGAHVRRGWDFIAPWSIGVVWFWRKDRGGPLEVGRVAGALVARGGGGMAILPALLLPDSAADGAARGPRNLPAAGAGARRRWSGSRCWSRCCASGRGTFCWPALAGDGDWVDTAMDRDSREVAGLVRSLNGRAARIRFSCGDFVRRLYVYTGLPAASRFLDSQPVTGVPADRHLVDSTTGDAGAGGCEPGGVDSLAS